MEQPKSKLDKTIDSLDPEAVAKVRKETQSLPAITQEEVEAQDDPDDIGFPAEEPITKSERITRNETVALHKVGNQAEAFICGLDKVETVLLLVVSKMSTFGRGMAVSMFFWAIAMGLMVFMLVRQEKILANDKTQEQQQNVTQEQQREMVAVQERVERKVEATEVKVKATQEKLDEGPEVQIVPDERRPGRAKLVVRTKPKPEPQAETAPAPKPAPAPRPAPTLKPKPAPAPAPTAVEIPINLPAKPHAPQQVQEAPRD